MKRLFFCFTFFTIVFGPGSISLSFSQENAATKSTNMAPPVMDDDPIAAVLDSLYKLNLFEKGYAKINYPKNPKYNFSPDSVPRYEELIYESRLAKLDEASPFDLQYNPIVKGYIEMYTFRKRELVSRMMALSQFYFPMFEEQLDKFNLPL